MLHSPQILASSPPRRPPSGGGSDAATTAWVNAVVAAGGAVSPTQQTRVDTFIKAMKAHSYFTKWDRLWLHGGESDAHQATIDIANLQVGTPNGTLTLSAGGYTGDGSTGYFDGGAGVAAGPRYTNALGTVGFYITSNRSSSGGGRSGADDAGTSFTMQLNPYNFGNAQFIINNGFVTNTVSDVSGLWIAEQSGGNSELYNWSTSNGNSGLIASAANASPNAATENMYFCGFNDHGTPLSFMVDTIAASFWGALSPSDLANFAADLNAYMTAWGVNKF